MGCGSCSSGGCSIKSDSGKSGGCSGCAGGSCNVLSSTDWLGDIFDWVNQGYRNLVEIRFKAGRKEFFINNTGKRLYTGDGVMVETGAGYHLGFVSLQGEMAHLQLKKKTPKANFEELKGLVRLATDKDFERYEEARNRELPSLYRTRQLAHELKLPMKLSDVEFQADGTKASFYYSSEERVDFRELIKTLGSEFKVRVDMRQISLRQEAGRIGGIGTCGRELCCSTWLTDFKGVATSVARYQNLSLNPTKLSGQCGRLKCCLNYELDTYLHELKDIPKVEKDLQTMKGYARLQKTDIFRKVMWFAYTGDDSNWIKIDISRVNFILEENRKGEKPVALTEEEETIIVEAETEVKNEDLIALDKKFSNKKKKKKKPSGQGGGQNPNAGPRPASAPNPNAGPRPNPNQGPNPAKAQNPGNRPNPNQGPRGNQPPNPNKPVNPNQGPRPNAGPEGQGQRPNPNQGPRPNGGGPKPNNPNREGGRPNPGPGGQGPNQGNRQRPPQDRGNQPPKGPGQAPSEPKGQE